MAHRFRRTRQGVETRLDDAERELLDRLFADVDDLLDDGSSPLADPLAELVGISEYATRPDDPALLRLLPDASRDDEEAAGEFRRFTERGLRARKQASLRTARGTLSRRGTLRLSDAEAQAWLTALTDVRLVLAERLELRTDEDAEALHALLLTAGDDEPRTWLAAVYDFLTWMQESLVGVLAEGLPDAAADAGPDDV